MNTKCIFNEVVKSLFKIAENLKDIERVSKEQKTV